MKNLLALLLFIAILASCEKVSSLSDRADVTSFQIYSTKPSNMIVNQVRITSGDENASDSIVFDAEILPNYFPIQILANIKTEGAVEILGMNLAEPIIFNHPNETHRLYLVAENGVVHTYTLALGGNSVLSVKQASVSEVRPEGLSVNSVSIQDDQFVVVNMKALWSQFPVSMKMDIKGSNISSVEGVDFSQALEFKTPLDTYEFTIKSPAGLSKKYTILIYSGDIVKDTQLPNPGFKLWTGSGTSINIDPIPGKGLGWGSANNSIAVQGTKPYTLPNGEKCAELKTNKVNNFLAKTIASGALYTGKFVLNIGQINTPKLMTWFGVPFTEKPKSVRIHLSYKPGVQMEKYEGGKFVNIPGVDKAAAWGKLLKYTGTGAIEYHGDPKDDIKELASYSVEIDQTEGWITMVLPFEYVSQEDPTHIAIVFSSSYRGDYFEGAPGSSLIVDEVTLVY